MRNAGLIQHSFFKELHFIKRQTFSDLGKLEELLIVFQRQTRGGCFQRAAGILPVKEKCKGRRKAKYLDMPFSNKIWEQYFWLCVLCT